MIIRETYKSRCSISWLNHGLVDILIFRKRFEEKKIYNPPLFPMFYLVCFFSGDFGHLGGQTGREIDLPPLLMLTIKSNSQLCWDLDFTHTWILSNA